MAFAQSKRTPSFAYETRGGKICNGIARGDVMSIAKLTTTAAISLVGVLVTSQAGAQSADAEIAALKQQLRLMEQKLDKLQKQTSANTTAAATANAKADDKVNVANTNAAYPIKG